MVPVPAAPPGEPAFVSRLRGIPNVEVCRASEPLGVCPFFIKADSLDGPTVRIDGRETVMLASNNYLGLTRHPEVMQAARAALEQYGTSCTGSRLLNGTIRLHTQFEEEIADFLGYPRAILFTTGYMANQGALSALIRRGDRVFSDRDNHASIVDGLGGFGVQPIRYNHNDMADLDAKLAESPAGRVKVVVSDSIFSMSGELVDFPQLMKVARARDAIVYLDEAHGIGTLGARGRGAWEHFGLTDKPDMVMGTLSKALAAIGGFVCGPAPVIDFLRFCARPFVFSASSAPAVTAAGLAALRVLRREPELVSAARKNALHLSEGLRNLGFDVGTPAVPILSLRAADTLEGCTLHVALAQAGVLTNMVMYPAVPRGQAMLRISVMSSHTHAHLDRALSVFAAVGRQVGTLGSREPAAVRG